jgi:hypothetical protein
MNFTHRKLCEDLAQTKDTKFFEVPLGSVWAGGAQIADVICIKPSYTRFLVDIYECKVSRSDFLSDLHSEKWKGYLGHCNRFYFAVLSGVAKKEEIPEGVGLIVRGEKGWSTIKMAGKIDQEIPYTTMMAMIFKKQSQDNFERRAWIAYYANTHYYENQHALKKILNAKVKKALAFYDKNKQKIERLEKVNNEQN